MIPRPSTMALLLPASLVTTLLGVAACGGGPSPSAPPPPSVGAIVTGKERFGWTQSASSPGDLAIYQYAVYVDGTRRVLDAVTCVASGPDTVDCSAPLPPLTAGQHTLAIGTLVAAGDTVFESSRSAPLQVTVAGSTASALASGQSTGPAAGPRPGPDGAQGSLVVSADGLEYAAEILASDLNDPVDVAVDATGRAFVAERAGRLRVIRRGADRSTDATGSLALSRGDERHVLSIALAPDFVHTGYVYVMHAGRGRDGSEISISRLREANGALGQISVLASYSVRDRDPIGVLRLGPDRVLYAGLGASTMGDEAQQLGSYGGKILRLNIDGTTPRDNPRSSPVYTLGHRDPRGLAWHPSDGTLWEAESSGASSEVNAIRAGANYGWPIAAERAGARDAIIPLASTADVSGLAIVAASTSPLFGDLIVSSRGARDLFQIRMGAGGDHPAVPPVLLLQGRFGAIAQVHAGADGALYFVTGNRETWGAGHDLLVRLVPYSR